MKRHLVLLPVLTLAVGILIPAPPASAAGDESVSNFIVSAQLGRDDVMQITEQIDYDFGDSVPRSVTRDIPTTYQNDQGNNYPMKFTLSEISLDGSSVNLKPHVNPSAAQLDLPVNKQRIQHYKIRYSLAPVILRGLTNDIFKLNITGSNWGVPIKHATFDITTPGLVAENLICYTGADAGTSGKCSVSENGNTVSVATHTALDPQEALTVGFSLPRGSFKRYLTLAQSLSDWLVFSIPVATLLLIIVSVAVFAARRAAMRNARNALREPATPKKD